MLVLNNTTGLEETGWVVLQQIAASVNTELVLQTSAWSAHDRAFASAFGTEYFPTILEPISPDQMYLGHMPSLIDETTTSFPNLSVMASDMTVSPTSLDQADEYLINFYVELLVKSPEGIGEDRQQREVNKMVQRTASSVHSVLMRDRRMRGHFDDTMLRTINITDAFVRREERARGVRFYWQGARLEYQVRVPADYGGL